MDALTALTTRYSAARLVEPAPPPDVLQKIFEAAASAPDHQRLKPWRFVVIDGAARERLGKLKAASFKRRNPNATPEQLEGQEKRAFKAPMTILCVAAVDDTARVPVIEQMMAVGAATQNLLLAVHALGYGAYWTTGPVIYDDEFKQGVGLSPSDEIVGLVFVGTASMPAPPREIDTSSVVSRWEG